jgi:hypothetical protein
MDMPRYASRPESTPPQVAATSTAALPVVGHPVKDDLDPDLGDKALILLGRQPVRHPLAVVRAINRDRGESGVGGEPAGMRDHAGASLVPTAAVTQQHQRRGGGSRRRQPQHARNAAARPGGTK